jgi:glycosyltransferase involved in cell wall biosynthesis
MKIAYVTETWPPEVNGVSLTVARTVSYLRSHGHEVELIRPKQSSDDGEPETVLVRGIPIPMYPDLRMGLPVARRLYRRWTDSPPDLVHIATEGPLGWSASRAARRLGIVATSDFRTRFDEYGKHYVGKIFSHLVNLYLRMFHNDTACTFVPTPEMRLLLQRAGYENLRVSERGVDADLFSPLHRSESLRASWGLAAKRDEPGGPAVLYVGRLAREKNLPLVFEAFDALRVRVPTARLIIVGSGPLRASFERSHPEVVFAGVQTGSALAAYYASADLFLFPSLTETFGNVTLEAMASGIPVVAYDSAAAGMYLRNGVSGYALPRGDSAAFIEAACELAADSDLRMRFSVAARCVAETKQWKDVLARFDAQIKDVILTKSCNELAKLVNS